MSGPVEFVCVCMRESVYVRVFVCESTVLTSAAIIVISLDRRVIRARTRTKPGLPERKNSRGRYKKTYRPTAYLTIAFDIKRLLVNVRSAKDTQALCEPLW